MKEEHDNEESIDKHESGKLKALERLTASAKQTSDKIKDYSHQIWLAGLGAYDTIEKEGQRAFDALVEMGQDLETKIRNHHDSEGDQEETSKPATSAPQDNNASTAELEEIPETTSTSKSSKPWNRMERAFDDRLSAALRRLGISSKADIDALSQRVAELQATVDCLNLKEKAASSSKPKSKSQKRTTLSNNKSQ